MNIKNTIYRVAVFSVIFSLTLLYAININASDNIALRGRDNVQHKRTPTQQERNQAFKRGAEAGHAHGNTANPVYVAPNAGTVTTPVNVAPTTPQSPLVYPVNPPTNPPKTH